MLYNSDKSSTFNYTSESLHLGIVLAIVGGFLDAYTFICRGGVFANAETGNIVLLGLAITKGNFKQAMAALLPILSFIIGVLLSEYRNTRHFIISGIYSKHSILILEIFVLFIIGFLPTTIPHILITTTISFVSSVQISSFRSLVGSPYSTTMCTGNLRSACEAAYIAISQKNSKQWVKSIRYIVIILSFTLGAIIGGILTTIYSYKSIWCCCILLILAVFLFSLDHYRLNKN